MSTLWKNAVWANMYRAAVLEPDPNKMPTKVRVARSAINARLSEIGRCLDDNKPEQQALEEALNVLVLLEKPRKEESSSW